MVNYEIVAGTQFSTFSEGVIITKKKKKKIKTETIPVASIPDLMLPLSLSVQNARDETCEHDYIPYHKSSANFLATEANAQTGSRISASLNSCTHWDMFRALRANPCPMRVAFQKPEM